MSPLFSRFKHLARRHGRGWSAARPARALHRGGVRGNTRDEERGPTSRFLGSVERPDQDVRVERELRFRTVQRLNAPTGPVMSPMISTESLAHPSHEDAVRGLAGPTSATGRPNLVTLIGSPVRRTSSRTARQVALNLEIAISRISILYHGPKPRNE
jgi:hypothetical protein